MENVCMLKGKYTKTVTKRNSVRCIENLYKVFIYYCTYNKIMCGRNSGNWEKDAFMYTCLLVELPFMYFPNARKLKNVAPKV